MTTEEQEVLEIFGRVGGLVTNDHLVYTSGNHGEVYVNKDAIYPHILEIYDLSNRIARRALQWGVEIEAVIGPEKGGIILAQWVAMHLQREMEGKKVLALYAEKDKDGSFVVKRGFEKLVKGKVTLVVEDVVNTAESVVKTIDAARAVGAVILGVVAIWNRGGIAAEQRTGVDYFSALVDIQFPLYPEASCPLCKEGRPINTSLGKGKEFLERQNAARSTA